jgi:putative restriction endonuclease
MEVRPGVFLGEVPGVAPGATFTNRRELHDQNVHRGLVQGIAVEGSCIVLNGGYVDDEDLGDVTIYTGEGGNDPNTGAQVADQQLSRGNFALAKNFERGVPVRVVRGPQHRSIYAPANGYRYDGLFRIARYWEDRGKDGYRIFRYRLERTDSASEGESGTVRGGPVTPAPRRTSFVSRVIRNTRVGEDVKQLYDHRCQVCGTQVQTRNGSYAECCHIRPLGAPHSGPDTIGNVLCLCPNCHVAFDTFAFTLSDDFLTSHSKPLKLDLRTGHQIGLEYVRYHRACAGELPRN